jgi:hypothetical protein
MASDLTEADRGEKSRIGRRALLALTLPLALAIGGCMRSTDNAASALSLDPMTTSAVSPLSAESEIMSDEKVVRDLVGGLDAATMTGPHPWSNALTGSAGVVTDLAVLTDGSKTCRLFQTTRHGFDGVALFDGRVCLRPDGGWDLVTFERVDG